jgi:hypothetical protein
VGLDQPNKPRELNATFHGEVARALNLPPCPCRAPRSHLAVPDDDDDLLEVHHVLQRIERRQLLVRREGRELGAERGRIRSLFRRIDTLDPRLCWRRLGIRHGQRWLRRQRLGHSPGVREARAHSSRRLAEVVDCVPPTRSVGPQRLLRRKLHEVRVQQRREVERLLGSRKRAAPELFNSWGHNVVLVHERRPRPPNDARGDREVRLPSLRAPLVHQRLAPQLRLCVQTVVAKHAVVGRARQQSERRAIRDAPLLLCVLDGTEKADDVGEHEPVRHLGERVDATNVTTTLGDGGKGHDVVDVKAELGVNVPGVAGRGER